MKATYIIWGKVKQGKKRGKNLGFPTLNMVLHRSLPEGIYISETKINKKSYPSVTFIGAAKTFGEKDFKAETYLLDHDLNGYGQWISVRLLKKIRDNQAFKSEKELIEAITSDVLSAREFFHKLR
ncbi:riboflavin kinase [Candidatus Daviesbacteria bacterium]|nr:riboflavin kinase [Candidatus Daviesbacteria bacterium]